MEKVFSFIDNQKDKFLSELIDFLSIPSISSEPAYKQDMDRCCGWLADNLKSIGFDDVRIVPTDGHSIILAKWNGAGKEAPTVLIYGHYDVQPVDPLGLWISPPFSPRIHNGKIWARGTADDKGQLFCHVKALESFFKSGSPIPCNIILLFEGEEECGSNNLDKFIIENAKDLQCDTVLVSDTEWFAPGLPSICYSLRGISYIEVTVTGPNRDLHSGSYGGGIDNPLNVLCQMVAQLKDSYGRITIPGFYDNVIPLSQEERQEFLRLPFNETEYCDDLGISSVNGEFGYTTLERVWARPTLDLNGIYGGYTGDGAKTILPTKATAKISMRLVPRQKSKDIGEKIAAYLKKIAPPTVKVDATVLHGGNPVLVPMDSPGVQAAKIAYKEAFNVDPVFMREGGSIPIVELFDEVLHSPTVLMGFGLPNDNVHSPNESYSLDNFFGGIKTSAVFLNEFSKMKKI